MDESRFQNYRFCGKYKCFLNQFGFFTFNNEYTKDGYFYTEYIYPTTTMFGMRYILNTKKYEINNDNEITTDSDDEKTVDDILIEESYNFIELQIVGMNLFIN